MSTPRYAGEACTPAERVTRSLLGYGFIAGPFYLVASVIEGLTRPGFDFTRDDGSLLAIGAVGWIHCVVLALTGLMVIAAAIGMVRQWRSEGRRAAAGWFLGGFGLGMVGAGLFPADPVNGFPPGSTAGAISWHGMLHLVCGGLGFVALVVACFLVAARFSSRGRRGWAAFSIVIGILYLAAFVGVASGSSSAAIVLGFTAAVVLAFLWLLLVCRDLFFEIGRAAQARSRAASAIA